MRLHALLAAPLFLAACANEKPAQLSGPGSTTAPNPSASASTTTASTAPTSTAPRSLPDLVTVPGSPINAVFVDLDKTPYRVPLDSSHTAFVGIAAGAAMVGEPAVEGGGGRMTMMGVGDLLRVSNTPYFDVSAGSVMKTGGLQVEVGPPSNVALIAIVALPANTPAPSEQLARAGDAPDLVFAHGAMHAHLDLQDSVVYAGRLMGTSAVPPHRHDGSWEIIGAVEGAGTFAIEPGDAEPANTDAGAYSPDAGPALTEQRLGPRQIVMVPPGRFHQWTPDAGTQLVAFQIYDPPGPEQRFKKLALAEQGASADGGAVDAAR
jgi:hypothetical protein